MVSSGDRAFVWWSTLDSRSSFQSVATTIAADGTLGPRREIEIPYGNSDQAVSGLRSVAITADYDCNRDPVSFGVTLFSDELVASSPSIADSTLTYDVTFDGAQYQTFWVTADKVVHRRTMSEDGQLGPVQNIGSVSGYSACLVAASDRVGTSLVNIDTDIGPLMFVIAPNGAVTTVPMPAHGAKGRPFWFRDEFHWPGTDTSVLSLDLVDLTFRERTVDRDVVYLFPPVATRTSMFEQSDALSPELLELDAEFRVIARAPLADSVRYPAGHGFVALGDTVGYVAELDPDPETVVRRVQLVGVASRTEVWRTELSADSQPHQEERCNSRPLGW